MLKRKQTMIDLVLKKIDSLNTDLDRMGIVTHKTNFKTYSEHFLVELKCIKEIITRKIIFNLDIPSI